MLCFAVVLCYLLHCACVMACSACHTVSVGVQVMLADTVSPNHIAKVISRQTGIPIDSLLTSESQKLLHMEDQLNKRVIGQSEAVNVISNCVRLARAGLHSHKRPLGVFLFLGPTGTQPCSMPADSCLG